MPLLFLLLGFVVMVAFIGIVTGIILIFVLKTKYLGIILTGFFSMMLIGGLLFSVGSIAFFGMSGMNHTSTSSSSKDDLLDDGSAFDDTDGDTDSLKSTDSLTKSFGQSYLYEDNAQITIQKPTTWTTTQKSLNGGGLYKVTVKFQNKSSKTLAFSPADIELADRNDKDAELIDSKPKVSQIAPGKTEQYTLYYDSYDTSPFAVYYGSVMWE